jgi:glycosyltransferase involved in cell wall biosynthesis
VAALRDVPEPELVIAGGPPRDELRHVAEYRRLMRLARAHGVADRVRFAGRVPREHMPALMRSADLLVSVPWYEPFGITPLEAMACGIPVVAAAVGGQTDTVLDGVTGVLVPPKQPRVLAGRIRELLADPTLRESLGIAGSQRARARYSWLRIGEQTAAMYERARRRRADPRRAAPGRADQRQVAAARQATGVGR